MPAIIGDGIGRLEKEKSHMTQQQTLLILDALQLSWSLLNDKLEFLNDISRPLALCFCHLVFVFFFGDAKCLPMFSVGLDLHLYLGSVGYKHDGTHW